jgi:hypothetical protein
MTKYQVCKSCKVKKTKNKFKQPNKQCKDCIKKKEKKTKKGKKTINKKTKKGKPMANRNAMMDVIGWVTSKKQIPLPIY